MISLSTLEINVVKKYLSHENQESAKRKLHRRFSKTIENCGGTLDCLREGNANITFPDEEAEFIKLILIQLVKEEGLSNKIWQNKDGVFSLDDIHQFIQDDIDYLEECGYDEATIKGVVKELDMLFQLSTRVKLEECHRILDCYALNIQPYLYTYQLKILEDLRQNLVREMVKSSVNAAIYCGEFGECIKDAMELSEAENVSDLYGEEDDLIKYEYVQRDKAVISFLNSNPEFKAYVEKQIGATINEIWRINDAEGEQNCSDENKQE